MSRQHVLSCTKANPDPMQAIRLLHSVLAQTLKRVDRLLGNRNLQTEHPLFYWVMLQTLLGSQKRPLTLIDWSPIDAAGEFFLLRTATPLAARSFPTYESVHKPEGYPKYQKRLLHMLAETLPNDCVPILVADADSRRP